MLSSKQRAFLRSMAHHLDPVFQIGKEGVTPEVVTAIDQALEARELIKLNVLKTCEDELPLVVDKVTKRTHSECVQMIGRRFSIYRRAKKPMIEIPR